MVVYHLNNDSRIRMISFQNKNLFLILFFCISFFFRSFLSFAKSETNQNPMLEHARYTKKKLLLSGDGLLIFNFFFLFYFINIIGALSLIQYCLKPDPNNRATTKDILRHDWLAHGPVLSIRFESYNNYHHHFQLTDQQSPNDYDNTRIHKQQQQQLKILYHQQIHLLNLNFIQVHFLIQLDYVRIPLGNKEQQRRNRVSAIPISTRYLSSNNTKANSIIIIIIAPNISTTSKFIS